MNLDLFQWRRRKIEVAPPDNEARTAETTGQGPAEQVKVLPAPPALHSQAVAEHPEQALSCAGREVKVSARQSPSSDDIERRVKKTTVKAAGVTAGETAPISPKCQRSQREILQDAREAGGNKGPVTSAAIGAARSRCDKVANTPAMQRERPAVCATGSADTHLLPCPTCNLFGWIEGTDKEKVIALTCPQCHGLGRIPA